MYIHFHNIFSSFAKKYKFTTIAKNKLVVPVLSKNILPELLVSSVSVMQTKTKSPMRLGLDKKHLDSQPRLIITNNLRHFTKLSLNILHCILCKYENTVFCKICKIKSSN